MIPKPGTPPNPALIVADTSALVQLIVGEEVAPLRTLKQEYGIRLVVHEAVDSELKWKIEKKFPSKTPVLRKAKSTGTIEVLSRALLIENGYKAADAVLDQIDTLGEQFAKRIHRGEAYTHAAGNILSVPALSQDLSALWALIGDGIDVQRPILRAFDVLIFGVQTSVIDWAACAKVRKNLLRAEETILPCFENCSVQDGMAKFYLRLCDANRDPLGAPAPAEKFDDRIYVRSVRQ